MSDFNHSSLNGSQSRRANFQSRTARDEFGELSRRTSTVMEEGDDLGPGDENPYEPTTSNSVPPPRNHSFSSRLGIHHDEDSAHVRRRSASGKRKSQSATPQDRLSSIQIHNEAESKKANGEPTAPKAGLGPRPIGGTEKLGVFSGVYVPTVLNVLSILML